MVRLKQPSLELLEKKLCLLCWPWLPVKFPLASNSNVSLGVTVFETTLNDSSPSSPRAACLLRNCCRMVVVCACVPSGLTTNEKSRSSGHSKRCTEKDARGSSSPPRVLVSEEIFVRCLIFCTNVVLVMLKSWRLEN